MEKVILKSTTDFVLQFGKEKNRFGYEEAYDAISGYANFLIQPLNLGMFVPAKLVNGVWVVLEEPTEVHEVIFNDSEYLKEYQEAKDRVLFEGFKIDKVKSSKKSIWITNGNRLLIFSLLDNRFDMFGIVPNVEHVVSYNLELTPTAQKQIGL